MFILKVKANGQGLLEAIVAIGIILIGLGAVLTLALKNIVATTASSQKIVASHLAREALEFVRTRRDSNWLKAANSTPDWQWDCGLLVYGSNPLECDVDALNAAAQPSCASGTNCGLSLNFNAAKDFFDFYYFPTRNVDDSMYNLTLYRAAAVDNYYWTQVGLVVPPDLISTNYRRLLTLDPICQQSDTTITVRVNASSCESGEIKIGLKAEARVSWLQGGILGSSRRYLTLTEYIYNWR